MSDDHHRALERIYRLAPCNAGKGPALSVGDGEARVTLGVRPEDFHGGRALHGHVLFRVLDDAAFFAASSVLHDELAVTASFHVHFLRPVRGGTLEARGRLVHRARRMLIADAVARDGRGREVARGTGSFLPGGVRLQDVPGYLET